MKECPLQRLLRNPGRVRNLLRCPPLMIDRKLARRRIYRPVARLCSSSPWTMRVLDVARNRVGPHVEHRRRSALADLPSSFVYVPLHVDPDAFTMVLSQWYTDSVVAIEALAKAAPARMRIAVKEHRPVLARRPRSQRSTSRRFRHDHRPDSRLFRNPDGPTEPPRTGRHTHLVPLPLATMWPGS